MHRVFPQYSVSSFENTLRNKFGFLQRPIPFVHPVDQRYVEEYTSLMLNDHSLSVLPTSSLTNHHENQTSKCEDHHKSNDYAGLYTNLFLSGGSTSYNSNEKKNDHDSNTRSNSITQLSMDGTQLLEARLTSLEETVQRSHSQAENDRNCIDELQRRLQLMELTLKAYYIDPEVFVGLNNSYTAEDNTTIMQEQSDSDAADDTPKKSSLPSGDVGRTLHARLTTAWRRRFRSNNNSSQPSLAGARKSSINSGDPSPIINEEIIIDNTSVTKNSGHYDSDSTQERAPFVKNK